MILVGSVKIKTSRQAREEVINMAVITKLVKGFDPDYPFKQQGRWAGDYFDVKGEPRGRWWGSGAAALGLEPGSEIDRDTHRKVIADHIDPRDGTTRLGRSPGQRSGPGRGALPGQTGGRAARDAQAAVRAAAGGREGGPAGPGLPRAGQLVLQVDQRILRVDRGKCQVSAPGGDDEAPGVLGGACCASSTR